MKQYLKSKLEYSIKLKDYLTKKPIAFFMIAFLVFVSSLSAQNSSPANNNCYISANGSDAAVDICAGTSVIFDISFCGSNNPSQVVYIITNVNTTDEQTVASGSNVQTTIPFNTPGQFSVNFSYTFGGIVATSMNEIEVNVAANANASNIAFNPIGTFCTNSNVCFSAESNVFLGTTYYGTINFGDGNVINYSTNGPGQWNNPFLTNLQQCVGHEYEESGVYDVVLTCTTACGTFQRNTTITIVNNLPVSIAQISVCLGSTSNVTLVASPSGLTPESYVWRNAANQIVASNPNGNSITIAGPFISSQSYSCTVTNANGCSGMANGNINVLPIQNISVSGSTDLCGPNPFSYQVLNPVAGTVYNWQVTGGNANSTSGTSNTITWNNIANGGQIIVSSPNICYTPQTLNLAPCCSPNSQSKLVLTGNASSFFTNGTTINPTYLSNNNYSGILVNNTFNVDINLDFDNVTIDVGINGKINIAPNKTLTIKDNSVVKAACNAMWDGIHILSFYTGTSILVPYNYIPGKLKIFNNCTIQDAKNAVVSHSGGLYEIEDNVTFNKNYKHIVVNEFTNSARNAQFEGYIRERTLFTCKETSTTNANNTLLAPYENRITGVAIEINMVDNIKIGSENVTGANTFEFSTYGIFSRMSSLIVKNNNFFEMNLLASNYQSDPDVMCPCDKGTAICGVGYTNPSSFNQRKIIVGGEYNGTYQNNTFENLVTAIDIRSNVNVDVIDNYFHTISRKGIKIYDNNWGNHYGHRILSNDMTDINWIFIDLNNNNCPKVIDNNTLNQNISSSQTTPSTYLATGISVSERRTDDPRNTHQSCQIEQNTIKAVKNGIMCNLVRNLYITNMNSIELNTADYNWRADDHGCGICLSACTNNEVRDNTVVAGSQWNWWVNGIWLADCQTNRVTCNAIGHTGFGLRFSGLNYNGIPSRAYMQNQIWNNRMHSNNCGFALTDGGIGDVKAVSSSNNNLGADNFWTGNIDGNSFFHTFSFSSWPFASIPNQYWANTSKLYLKSFGDQYGPSPFYWAGKYSNGSGGYVDESGEASSPVFGSLKYAYQFANGNLLNPNNSNITGGVDINCQNSFDLYQNEDLLLDNVGQIMQIQNGSVANNPQQASLWWEKYNLYNALLKDVTLIDSPEKLAFKTQTDQEALGLLTELSKRLQDTLYTDSLGILETKMLNNAIATSNEPEENLKKLNDYISGFLLMQKDSFQLSFSSEQVAEMQNMAMLCPSLYGPGVYGIRALLKSIDSLSISYRSPCEMAIDPLGQSGGNNQRRGSVSAAQRGDLPDFDELAIAKDVSTFEATVLLYPNPAQNLVNVESKESNIVFYELSSPAGIILKTERVQSTNFFTIDVSKLSSGFYILKFFNTNNQSTIQKFNIIK
jgi:hypothetical protein